MLIIAVSYDAESLNRRITSLQNDGHAVVPASSLKSCLSALTFNNYDLLVIGATVPMQDRQAIAAASRRIRKEGQILSVEWPGEKPLATADRMVQAGDESGLLAAVRTLARRSA